MALDKNEFSIFAVGYLEWSRGIRKLGPPPPPGQFAIINKGSADYDWDSPLSPRFSAFSLALVAFDPKEIAPMWSVYFERPREYGKRIPVKALASKLGISQRHFYNMANEVAERLYRRSLDIMDMQKHWDKFAEAVSED